MPELFIARQPIYDFNLQVYGYELLYRSNMHNNACFQDGRQATSQVLINAFIDIGLEKLVSGHRVFINMPEDLLLNSPEIPLPVDRTVLEVPTHNATGPSLVEAVRQHKEKGYTIALDNFELNPQTEALIPYVDLAKIDISHTSLETIAALAKNLRKRNIKLLALKIEDPDQVTRLLELGFEFLQGNFLSRPKIIHQQRLSSNRAAVMRLLSKIYDPDIEIDELVKLISTDVGLSYRLIRYLNSAFFNLVTKIESIHHAATYLGREPIKVWVCILTLAKTIDKPSELMKLALIRGKMCESLAKFIPDSRPEAYFTAGLFSALDMLLDQSMGILLAELPLSDALKGALLSRQGPMGEALTCTLAIESCDLDDIHFQGLSDTELNRLHVNAIDWAEQAQNAIVD